MTCFLLIRPPRRLHGGRFAAAGCGSHTRLPTNGASSSQALPSLQQVLRGASSCGVRTADPRFLPNDYLMLSAILILAAFATAAAYAYHRWHSTGVGVLCLALLLQDVARGTWEWSHPHQDLSGTARPWDWGCHATGLLWPLVMMGAGVAITLYGTRGRVSSLAGRIAVAAGACALLAVPMVLVLLWWSINVLHCDTL